MATRGDVLDVVLGYAPEVMGIPLDASGPLGPSDLEAVVAAAEKKDALVIGPGIPRGPETTAFLGELLSRIDCPAVLDADALNAVAEDLGILRRAKTPLILTPHPGEMARLVGMTTDEVQASRIEIARNFAVAHHVFVVLKGHRTLIATPDEKIFINPTGNPGMATGGTGDVLTGMIAGWLAQLLDAEAACKLAVYLHGMAGDLAEGLLGDPHAPGQFGDASAAGREMVEQPGVRRRQRPGHVRVVREQGQPVGARPLQHRPQQVRNMARRRFSVDGGHAATLAPGGRDDGPGPTPVGDPARLLWGRCYLNSMRSSRAMPSVSGITSQIVPAAVALMVTVRIMPTLMSRPCSKKPAKECQHTEHTQTGTMQAITYQHHHPASSSSPSAATEHSPAICASRSLMTSPLRFLRTSLRV